MTWKPKPDIDENVRQWMKAKGWEVNRTEHGARSRVYAWRHEVRGKHADPSHLTRSPRGLPPLALMEHLARLRAAAAISAHPEGRLVVVQTGTSVTLEER
jgi:DNA-binding transcriptional ArsR family regulator